MTLTSADGTPKLALVTGSSRGLGRSAALHIAKSGADVIITYHSNPALAQTIADEVKARGRKAAIVQLNVEEVSSFASFSQTVGETLKTTFERTTFDFLINNAGYGVRASFAETTEEAFDKMMNVHLKGVFFLTQKLLPLIADGGRIVNLSSGLARFTLPGMSAYAAMKGGVEVLTKYMAAELGPRGICANVVAPGAIETDFGGGAVRDNPDLNRHVASNTALGRAGVADDIGPMIASLLSENNRWINGQCIEVSGGAYL